MLHWVNGGLYLTLHWVDGGLYLTLHWVGGGLYLTIHCVGGGLYLTLHWVSWGLYLTLHWVDGGHHLTPYRHHQHDCAVTCRKMSAISLFCQSVEQSYNRVSTYHNVLKGQLNRRGFEPVYVCLLPIALYRQARPVQTLTLVGWSNVFYAEMSPETY